MSSPRPLTILFENDAILAVEKPPRMMSVPAPKGAADKGKSVLERLRAEGRRAFPVHRLDFETSGVLLFGKSPGDAETMVQAFRDRRVEKVYHCLVQGWPAQRKGRLNFPIKDLGASAVISRAGKPAQTDFEVLKRVGPCALIEARIETGRHNQIRLHFNQIGHPLVGERKFARGKDYGIRHKRCLLHASRLVVPEANEGATLRLESDLPSDFRQAMDKAREFQGNATETPGRSAASRTGGQSKSSQVRGRSPKKKGRGGGPSASRRR